MNRRNSHQESQQQQHQLPNQQQTKQAMIELTQELVRKQNKQEKLMKKSAHNRASTGQRRIRLDAFKKKVANANEIKNGIAKICNTAADWTKETQTDLDKIKDTIELGRQYVNGLHELNEQEIRNVEFELAKLTSEDELNEYVTKMREQQQELADINTKIKEMEDFIGDNEEIIVQKLREVQQSNEVLEKAQREQSKHEQPKPEHQPANPVTPSLKTETQTVDYLVNYFDVSVTTAKKEAPAAVVTSTNVDSDDKNSDASRYDYGLSDDSLSS